MRRYDIDALRVIAFGLLILYHVGMFFVPWDFHIKNNIIYPDLVYPMSFLNQWRLPLLFVISGMGVYFAFQKRTGGQFAVERVRRLLIPLIFGMLFIVPPQIYFEYLDHGVFNGSYLFDFWPREVLTKGLYKFNPDGALSWHHLWFILYLFIFSIALIPLFVYLRKHPKAWLIRTAGSLAEKKAGLYLFIVPLFLWEILLQIKYPTSNTLVGDWYALVNFCTLFFYGFLLISVKEKFWNNVTQNRWLYLVVGIIGFTLIIINQQIDPYPYKYIVFRLIKVFNLWSWILALFGFAAVYLNKPGKFLSYANEAVYPFYILHQTVIITLGYYLKDVSMGFWPKFSIMSIFTFLATWIIYEFLIRRYNPMRFLFGMRRKLKPE